MCLTRADESISTARYADDGAVNNTALTVHYYHEHSLIYTEYII